MADRRKIEERIKKKEQEIQHLEEQVREAKIYVQALQDVLRMFPRDANPAGEADATLRPGSLVAQAREAILKRGHPMHVSQILKDVGKEASRTNKTALGGSISAYVRKGQIFSRPSPNTFGLLELGPVVASSSEPPPDFGIDRPEPEGVIVEELPK
jgi:hypothetical protein